MREQRPDRPYNVLFLCTGNSARSVFAEVILNKIGKGKFVAYSAGSDPKGAINPHTLALLTRLGFSTEGLRSKSWDEFAVAGAPELDFVFTVCDNAANEVCPAWPGQPMTAHWGVPDPAAVEGDAKTIDATFRDAFMTLQRRIELFANLPVKSLDRMSLKKEIDQIGKGTDTGKAPVTIYHNPACGTSRNVLGLICNSGEEPEIIEYLKNPPTRAKLEQLIAAAGLIPRTLLREKGTPYHELKLDDPKWTDDELIGFMLEHPILINRPIVVTPRGVRLCRPSEVVLDILLNPRRGAFIKEDGELVVGAAGQRIVS